MIKNKKLIFILLVFLFLIITGFRYFKRTEIKSDSDLTMFITTDIHYLAPSLTDGGKAYQEYLVSGDARQLNYIDEVVSALSRDIINKQPDILIISGDLTNNGEKESHTKLAEKLKVIEAKSYTRIFVIPGNHDILNPWARSFKGDEQVYTESIGPEEFTKIYKDFGYGEAISKDENSLSYLSAASDEVWLLMLDTNEYNMNEELGMPTTNGMIGEETFEWIKECTQLAKKNNARIVMVMHHNLFNHNERMYYGFTLDNSDEAVKVFQECGINLVLSGHVHIQDIKTKVYENNTMYDIVTSALCNYPQQYGILKYDPDKGFDYSTDRVDVENWAKENDLKDENLLSFATSSKEYYKQASFNKTYNRLSKLGIYSEENMKLMAEIVSILNANYFAGTLDSVKEEVEGSPGYELWLKATEPEFMKDYVIGMVTKENVSNNKLFIPINY